MSMAMQIHVGACVGVHVYWMVSKQQTLIRRLAHTFDFPQQEPNLVDILEYGHALQFDSTARQLRQQLAAACVQAGNFRVRTMR